MSYCINRRCSQPHNPPNANFCLTCGRPLRLRDRYRLLNPLGKGGFGRTYLAVDEDLPSRPCCVVKQLHHFDRHSPIGEKVLELFQREAENLDRLGEHPQIPSLFAYFEEDNEFYLVQEWIDGHTLAQELQQQGTFNEQQVRQLLQQLLPVLQYIHDRHAIHRDIKPENLMRRRETGELVLIDFGVVKVLSETRLVSTGTAVGSAEFMAPEQHRGQAFPATDLYSLGVTCIHLLTGMSPLELYDVGRGCWKWRPYLPVSCQISDRLAHILDRLLETPLERRFHCASEVLTALKPSPVSPKPKRPTAVKLEQTTVLSPSWWERWWKKPPEVPLRSEVDLDYRELRDALKKQQWETSDRLTHRLLCCLVRGTPGGYLTYGEVSQLPCTDLDTLDRLWVQYSQGRFGFRVQQQIYDEVGQNYPEFCQHVGWPLAKVRSVSSSFQFNRRAPVGHLPSRRWAGGLELWRHIAALHERLEICDAKLKPPRL